MTSICRKWIEIWLRWERAYPNSRLEQLNKTRQHFVCSAKLILLCSTKTNTTTPGKLGRAVGFSTRASRAGVGFYTTLQVYCNWFVSDFTLLSFSIYLFYYPNSAYTKFRTPARMTGLRTYPGTTKFKLSHCIVVQDVSYFGHQGRNSTKVYQVCV